MDRSNEAAPPEVERAGDRPARGAGPGWRQTLMKTFREFNRDQCGDLAAALAYYAVFAIAPASLALVSLLGAFGDGQAIVERVLRLLEEDLGAPRDVIATIEPIVTSLATQPGAGIGLVVGAGAALWSASGFVNAFGRAMNRIYEVDEGRPVWRLRPAMLLVTLVMLVIVAVILAALVLSGGVAATVGDLIGLSDATVAVWAVVKWPVVVVLVALLIAILFWATPNARLPFRWISAGSVVALVAWVVATAAFGAYVATFGGASYDKTYGALAGAFLFLLWLWITNNALLFGAELDSELERTRQLLAGIEAEEVLQLRPRATSASRKNQRKRAEDVAAGRLLRLEAQAARQGGPGASSGQRDGA